MSDPPGTKRDEARMQRAIEWYLHGTPVGAMQARLVGEDVPTRFTSLVCLYPAEDLCAVYIIQQETPDTVAKLRQVYPLIKKLQVPQEKLDIQRAFWHEHMEAVPSREALWRITQLASETYDLPIAFLAFGRSAEGNQPAILLQAFMGAPLDLALRSFQNRTKLFR